MFYFLFAFYLTLGCYWMTRLGFIKKTGLEKRTIIILFLVKITAGVFLGWISNHFSYYNDYWGLNREGIAEYNLMIHQPREFFTNIFHSPYENAYGGFFNSVGSYWNDLKNNIILKLLACCNIFSKGNYYINSLFFNTFGFLGHVAIFRIFYAIYPQKKWLLIFGSFLLPSTIYFSSGIHKDLIVFTMLGFFCYTLFFSITEKWTIKRNLLMIISALAILLTRNYVFVALIPATLALLISHQKKRAPLFYFILTYAVCFLLLLVLQLVIPSIQPLKVITQKQRDFLDLPVAASQLPVNIIEPTILSFIQNTPQAVNHGLMRPYIWENKGKFMLLLALELLAYQLLLLLFVFWHEAQKTNYRQWIFFVLFFTLSMFLITGFIIPNTGSIVRYKSIYLPYLIIPLLCSIDWSRFKKTY